MQLLAYNSRLQMADTKQAPCREQHTLGASVKKFSRPGDLTPAIRSNQV